ncbi:uncharacterized protein [Gorilla gorilla gorilla]|uniref:uncharacterized protein n=1 Tax=Gorilla gorilla gorilla TaxID=9595 RepID=UPI00300B4A6E
MDLQGNSLCRSQNGSESFVTEQTMMRAQAAWVRAEGGPGAKGAGRVAPGGWQHAWARRGLPSPSPSRPQESGSPTAERRGKGGGRELEEKKGSAESLTLLSAGSWAGWVARGGEKGRGRGRGKGGALARCSFRAAPAAATAGASFPIHSNKQDGCRYAAALPAAQILGSNRQDVYGQNGTCAPAQLAQAPPEGAAQAQ